MEIDESVLKKFQTSIFRESDPKKFGRDLILYLLAEYTLDNITGQNYFSEEKTDEVFASLVNLLQDDSFILPEEFTDFFVALKEVIEGNPKYTRTLTLPEDMGSLELHATDTYYGKNRVDLEKSTFFVDTDAIFSNPKSLESVLPKLYDKIEELRNPTGELDFDKFCFIEKRKGPVGAYVLTGLLTSKYHKPSVIYRPSRLPPLTRISGQMIEAGERICLVHDVPEEELKATVYELNNVFDANVKYAIIIANYKPKVSKELREMGITTKSVFEFSDKEISKYNEEI